VRREDLAGVSPMPAVADADDVEALDLEGSLT
jgi:hypothetical protein